MYAVFSKLATLNGAIYKSVSRLLLNYNTSAVPQRLHYSRSFSKFPSWLLESLDHLL